MCFKQNVWIQSTHFFHSSQTRLFSFCGVRPPVFENMQVLQSTSSDQSDMCPLHVCTPPQTNDSQWFCSNTLHCVRALWLYWLTVLMEGSRTTSLDQSTDGEMTKEAECKQMFSLGRVLPWVCVETKCFSNPSKLETYQWIKMNKKTVGKKSIVS